MALGSAMVRVGNDCALQGDSERDFNLCNLSDEQRKVAAIDTEVCFWLWLLQAGKITHADIVRVLSRMDSETADVYRGRLNHWRDSFKPSIKTVERFSKVSQRAWQQCLASFKQQTARFGQ